MHYSVQHPLVQMISGVEMNNVVLSVCAYLIGLQLRGGSAEAGLAEGGGGDLCGGDTCSSSALGLVAGALQSHHQHRNGTCFPKRQRLWFMACRLRQKRVCFVCPS